MTGYFKEPEITAEVFENGYFKTGEDRGGVLWYLTVMPDLSRRG